jgi:hypothetical protein
MKYANPSSFYDQLVGAEKFSLIFPLSEDCAGPCWLGSGELVHSVDGETDTEEIEAVSLGRNRYRLTERCLGPFSSLRLHWGDEFFGDRLEGNTLSISKVVVPRPFEHFRFLTSGEFKNANPIAELVHEVGGGWETAAGGMLTLTVPALRVQEFQSRMNSAGLLPGVLRLAD